MRFDLNNQHARGDIMSFRYGINRLLDLHGTNFEVFDMDVKEELITFTVKHKEDVQYICKHCGHAHDTIKNGSGFTIYHWATAKLCGKSNECAFFVIVR